MTPLTANARRLAAYLAACLLAGLGLAGAVVNEQLATWPAALLFALPMSCCLGFVAASAYYVCRSVVFAPRSTVQTAIVFSAAAVLSGVLWVLLCQGWNELGASLFASMGRQLLTMPPSLLLVLLLLGSASYLISLLLHDMWLAAEELRFARAREAQSRLQARDAQLQVLRTQINPHFLFNSLNSISALTSQNAAAARAMTLELAAFFRQTLALAEKERIALSEEIALCEHFLGVEKIRFGDKLRTDIQASDAARAALIPPMLLQPCVENAVKHGVRHLPDGGCISLRAFVQEPWLYVTIENPVDADAVPSAGTGTGLGNIKQRLATLYGEQARIQWKRGTQTFLLEIVLPVDVMTSIRLFEP